jgi:hypothetical protein
LQATLWKLRYPARKFINGLSFAIVPLGHCRMMFMAVVGVVGMEIG